MSTERVLLTALHQLWLEAWCCTTEIRCAQSAATGVHAQPQSYGHGPQPQSAAHRPQPSAPTLSPQPQPQPAAPAAEPFVLVGKKGDD